MGGECLLKSRGRLQFRIPPGACAAATRENTKMILDRIERAACYRSLGSRIAMALDALAQGELIRRPPGRYELDGERVFAMVQEYPTRPVEQGKWEAHRRYIDVQFVASGKEVIGCGDIATMKTTQPYDEQKDVIFLEGAGNMFSVPAGSFAIFFPHDAHMPCLACGETAAVKKVVVKVRVD